MLVFFYIFVCVCVCDLSINCRSWLLFSFFGVISNSCISQYIYLLYYHIGYVVVFFFLSLSSLQSLASSMKLSKFSLLFFFIHNNNLHWYHHYSWWKCVYVFHTVMMFIQSSSCVDLCPNTALSSPLFIKFFWLLHLYNFKK